MHDGRLLVGFIPSYNMVDKLQCEIVKYSTSSGRFYLFFGNIMHFMHKNLCHYKFKLVFRFSDSFFFYYLKCIKITCFKINIMGQNPPIFQI